MAPNMYRTISEALESFDYITKKGNFSRLERLITKYGGAAAMYMASKKLKEERKIFDERAALYEAAEMWIKALNGKEFLKIADIRTSTGTQLADSIYEEEPSKGTIIFVIRNREGIFACADSRLTIKSSWDDHLTILDDAYKIARLGRRVTDLLSGSWDFINDVCVYLETIIEIFRPPPFVSCLLPIIRDELMKTYNSKDLIPASGGGLILIDNDCLNWGENIMQIRFTQKDLVKEEWPKYYNSLYISGCGAPSASKILKSWTHDLSFDANVSMAFNVIELAAKESPYCGGHAEVQYFSKATQRWFDLGRKVLDFYNTPLLEAGHFTWDHKWLHMHGESTKLQLNL